MIRWSRGRDLNPRPADYEMNASLLSLLLSVSLILSQSPAFAPFRWLCVQRFVQRFFWLLCWPRKKNPKPNKIGRHPPPAKQAGINLAFFAGESAVFYFTEHNRHAWVRWTGRAILAHSVIEHSHAAACNAGIDLHAPGPQNCRPLVF